MRDMLNDTVRLIKTDGRQFDNIKASVQRRMIFSDDTSIPIEEGDVFERELPSGITEKYRVTDAGYHEGMGGIESHYQSKIEKITRLDSSQTPKATHVVYNLIGENARINIQSHDSSTNVVNVQPNELFAQLTTAIESHLDESAERTKLLQAVLAMQNEEGTPGFLTRYQEFIGAAADYMTLLAPFMPALAQMLTDAT